MSNQIINVSYSDTISVDFTSNAYFNATTVGKSFGKLPNEWLRLESTKEYIQALSIFQLRENPALEQNQLVETRSWSPENGGGTWLHPKLAVAFARWLDVGFSIWCDMQIDRILRQQQKQQTQHQNLPYTLKDRAETCLLIANALNYSESGKLTALALIVPELKTMLPTYAIDKSTNTIANSSDTVKSLTAILEGTGISAIKGNKILEELGLLDSKTRKGKTKDHIFKNITSKGLEFGKNAVNPQNPRETQPLWFEHKTKELINIIIASIQGDSVQGGAI